MNWSTIIVAGIVAVIFLAIVYNEARRIKSGKGSCSCCSGSCASCGLCGNQTQTQKQ